MKHLGDITKISGTEAAVVDCIIGGSPCQDLSIAGKREGLAGKRSGLFMEQIRIVKEMRQHERDIGRTGQHVRPRYMVWENVPGAFSILRNCEMANADIAEAQSCVKREKILEYSGGHEVFGWHVSDLVIYDKPKELSEFSGLRQTKFGLEPVSLKRPPQSWCYIESEEK